jgi:putative ABC transport system permease protein
MNGLRQILAVVDMNLRNLPRRLGASLVIVLGVAGVVGVLISVLALATGFSTAVANTGSPDRAIILASGALAESMSSIPGDALPNIIGAPGIARDSAGVPIAQAETLAQVQVAPRGGGNLLNLTLRGVDHDSSKLRPEIHLVEGRMFRSGLQELIVGKNAQAQFAGLGIGSHLSFQNGDWVVVGTFASTPPSLLESELLADTQTLLSAFQRNWFASITARLQGPHSLAELQRAIKADPTLHVTAIRESDYTAGQANATSFVLTRIGYIIGIMMASGALFGALNTLYAAVSARSLEIAQLRAIGFGGVSVAVSVLAEALLLSIGGASLGALIAWLLFNGHVTSMSLGGLQQGRAAFEMSVTPWLLLLGIIWGCVIGLLGGLPPAVRAAYLPVARALNAGA